ncbi:MAG: carboxypeptidase-like regulatory domain-containing protein [Candidatus Hydrogenedentes bacterium]|nr:carboxypeptidase-like regulatory domain-containing protein [Candidatus Hydrogenedentota bacterium]
MYEGSYSITGTVTDASGKPLEGAHIFYGNALPSMINHASAATDADGRFELESFPVSR